MYNRSMKSPKEISVDQKLVALTNEIIELTEEKDQLPLLVVKELIEDAEIEAVQNYANNVSIVRLGYNDHGPVHMRTVCRNALKMLKILYQAGIKTSLELDAVGLSHDAGAIHLSVLPFTIIDVSVGPGVLTFSILQVILP